MEEEKTTVDGLLRSDPERGRDRHGRPLGGAILLTAVGLAFGVGVVVMGTYCAIQSIRNEWRVSQLEVEVERLTRQMASGSTSGLLDERDDDPYDEYGEYGDSFLSEDDVFGDDAITDEAVFSRIKRRANKNRKKADRKRRVKKDRNTKEKINKYIEEKIKESTGMAAIHLHGALTHNTSIITKLRTSPRESLDYPALHGRLYQQGFVTNEEIMAFWEQAPWSDNKQTNKVFEFEQDKGSVKIKKSGIYFIYAQVYYRTAVTNLSFQISVNNATRFSCKSPMPAGSENARTLARGCYTGGLLKAEVGDEITIWNRYHYPIVLEQTATFWGLIAVNCW